MACQYVWFWNYIKWSMLKFSQFFLLKYNMYFSRQFWPANNYQLSYHLYKLHFIDKFINIYFYISKKFFDCEHKWKMKIRTTTCMMCSTFTVIQHSTWNPSPPHPVKFLLKAPRFRKNPGQPAEGLSSSPLEFGQTLEIIRPYIAKK